MLDKNDIKILRGMFRENNEILRREIRDETYAIVRASESRLEKKFEKKIDDKIDGLRTELLELLDEHVLQPIAELQVAVFPAR